MLLAAGYRAERCVVFAVNFIAFALTGARDKPVRMVGIYRQGKEGETLAGAGQFLELFPGFVQYRVVVKAPVVAVMRVGNGRF